ncbi:sugar nucleotide-binding protein [Coprobacillus cateniformis]|uniref:sugar nucleotide-binding protein n=1 Tax=Coprobacillus cateniformis TaxID=100884 RepID=UPI00399FF562
MKKIKKTLCVNAIGARNLSINARKISAKLVHISTGDIFNGTKEKPFDEPNPSTVYGKSKIASERFMKEFTKNTLL